jgi:hypothetical protein
MFPSGIFAALEHGCGAGVKQCQTVTRAPLEIISSLQSWEQRFCIAAVDGGLLSRIEQTAGEAGLDHVFSHVIGAVGPIAAKQNIRRLGDLACCGEWLASG